MSQSFRFRPNSLRMLFAAAAVIAVPILLSGAASAQTLSYAPATPGPFATPDVTSVEPTMAEPSAATDENSGASVELPEQLRRAIVAYNTREAPGTVIIDTAHTALYYVLGNNRALRYGVGVGREGFTWSGVQTVSRKAEWPDWYPPAEMVARQPYLPRFMAGGPGNPLGARAMYLGSSQYRIHGTNDPSTIGKFVSSGCIRLTNEDVEDLFNRVQVGAKVIVLPRSGRSLEARRGRNTIATSHRPASSPHIVASPPQRQAMNLMVSRPYQ